MAEWGPSILVWSVILSLFGVYIVLRVRTERKDREYMRDLQARANAADKARWEWVEQTDKCPTCSGCGRVERRQHGEQEADR